MDSLIQMARRVKAKAGHGEYGVLHLFSTASWQIAVKTLKLKDGHFQIQL